MFWGAFRKGKMGPGFFFKLEKGQKITSLVYRDQVLLGSLKTLVDKAFSEGVQPIVIEHNTPVHKWVNKKLRKRLE